MKYKGRVVSGLPEEVIPILRPSSEDGESRNIFLVARGISNFDIFQAICPMPQPPKIMLPGNKTKFDIEDKYYISERSAWFEKRTAWIVIESLKATDGLEWQKVDMSDPSTYNNYKLELEEAGFVDNEIERILSAVLRVNALDETQVEAARKSFLTTPVEAVNGQSSRSAGLENTQSGVPAKEVASNSQEQKMP